MRTRRSPRNQEILWRELGGPAKPKPAPVATDTTGMWWLSKRTRAMLERDKARAARKAAWKAAAADKPVTP